jgi:hypothetical protein
MNGILGKMDFTSRGRPLHKVGASASTISGLLARIAASVAEKLKEA